MNYCAAYALVVFFVCITPVYSNQQFDFAFFSNKYTEHYYNLLAKYQSAKAKIKEASKSTTVEYLLDNYMYMTENHKTSNRQVDARNSQYYFTLNIKEDRPEILSLQQYKIDRTEPWCRLIAPVADPESRSTYWDLFNSNKLIKFHHCQAYFFNQIDCYQVAVRLRSVHPESKKQIEFDLYYYFDPKASWVCIGTHSDPTQEPYLQIEYNYLADSSSLPALHKLTRRLVCPSDPQKARVLSVTEIESIEYGSSLPPSAYRLSAFGLPEPAGVDWEQPTKPYVWMLVIAGLLFLLSLVFYYLKRRAERSQVR
jgi:hypothetical protein